MFCYPLIRKYRSAYVDLLVFTPKSAMHPILLPNKSTDSSGHTGKSYTKESLLSEMLSVAHLKCISYFLNKSNTVKPTV